MGHLSLLITLIGNFVLRYKRTSHKQFYTTLVQEAMLVYWGCAVSLPDIGTSLSRSWSSDATMYTSCVSMSASVRACVCVCVWWGRGNGGEGGAYVYVRVRMHAYACGCACVHVCEHVRTCMCACMLARKHVHAILRVHVHT